MVKYIIKRLLLSILIVIGVSLIIYLLIRMMPLNYFDTKYAAQLANGTMTQADVDNFKRLSHVLVEYNVYADRYGWGHYATNELAEAALTGGQKTICTFLSYVEGYANWFWEALHGNLGSSFKFQDTVVNVIKDNMWVSFGIAIVATVLQFAIAIPLGVTAATHQYSAFDYVVTVLVMMGISLPTFFFALLMLSIFSQRLGWFPLSGMNSPGKIFNSDFEMALDTLHHLVLPVLTLVILSIGGLMRYTRTNMLEVLNADYIRTARAKGCSERTVIYRHAFRNTLIPVVTMLAGILPGLFGGAMITEQVFGLPGIGNKAYQALIEGDIPFVMGYNVFLAILSVFGTLLSDLMYAVVDPRVKINK